MSVRDHTCGRSRVAVSSAKPASTSIDRRARRGPQFFAQARAQVALTAAVDTGDRRQRASGRRRRPPRPLDPVHDAAKIRRERILPRGSYIRSKSSRIPSALFQSSSARV